MRQRTVRRAVAAASATAMAGAALVVGGAGVASADPVTGTGQTDANFWGNSMWYSRTVSNDAPTYGDTVTITTQLERRGGTNANLIYWIEDLHPGCFNYVDNSATWTIGTTEYAHSDKPSEVYVNDASLKIDPPALNSWIPPVKLVAEYVVNCAAGPLPTGGLDWDGTTFDGTSASKTVGPTVTVKRLGTSVFLAQPAHPEVGKPVALNVSTTNVPDGDQVTFTVDGETVGVAPVSNNQASLTYTPTSAGAKEVRANFVQTPTHGGSASIVRTMTVSQANVESSVSVTASDVAKVGQATQLTATVSPADAGGTVTFSDHGTEIGSAPVGADGTAIIDWIPSVAGERTIDADFSGRTGVNPSNGATSVTVAAADPDDVATNTTLAEIPNAQVGEQITLTATVDAGVTGGSVSFYDDGVLIGTANVNENGQATLNWTPTTEGDRTVRAVFSGHGVYLSSDDSEPAFIAPAIVEPEPDPDPTDPTDPDTGSLGSLTGSGDAGNASGSLGSLSNFGS